jgi:hypothetical protein
MQAKGYAISGRGDIRREYLHAPAPAPVRDRSIEPNAPARRHGSVSRDAMVTGTLLGSDAGRRAVDGRWLGSKKSTVHVESAIEVLRGDESFAYTSPTSVEGYT